MASRTRILNVPAGAGGLTILATWPTRRYTITESTVLANGTANVPGGLLSVTDQTPLNSGNPAGPAVPLLVNATIAVPPDDDTSFHAGQGNVIANGPSVQVGVGAVAALPLCKVVSSGAASAVIVTEIA
jgi:hypothetical protein